MPAFVVTALVGIVCIVLGISNMKGNISSLHSYHRSRVSEEDRIPFGKKVGLGTIIIGAGGTAGTSSTHGGNGGDSSVTIDGNTYTGGGGNGGGTHGLASPALGSIGGTGDIMGDSGAVGAQYTSDPWGGTGGGTGGGVSFSITAAQGYGGGGAGGTPSRSKAAGTGYQGIVWFEYFDSSLNP
jgi:hypothetical protein